MLGHQLHPLERAEALQEETRRAVAEGAEEKGQLRWALRRILEAYELMLTRADRETSNEAQAFLGASMDAGSVVLGD